MINYMPSNLQLEIVAIVVIRYMNEVYKGHPQKDHLSYNHRKEEQQVNIRVLLSIIMCSFSHKELYEIGYHFRINKLSGDYVV